MCVGGWVREEKREQTVSVAMVIPALLLGLIAQSVKKRQFGKEGKKEEARYKCKD